MLGSSAVAGLGTLLAGAPAEALLVGVLVLVALGFRVSPNDAVRAGLLVGVGFVGVYLVVGLAVQRIAPAAARLAETTPAAPTAVDVGWPVAATVGFGVVEIGFWIVPLFAVLNVLLYRVGFTYTLDVDVWNYWHFAFIAGLVFVTTGNWPYAVAVGLTLGLFSLVVADWFQPAIEESFELDDVSIPHAFTGVMAVLAIPVDLLVRRTPLGNVEADPTTVQERLGVLGQPVFLGVVVGLGVGLAAYRDALAATESWYAILELAVVFAALMYILPEVAGILIEGMDPLSEAVREWLTDRGEEEVAVGLDAAVLVGDEAVAAAGILMVPIALAMMLVLPGNELLWGVDLATLPFFVAMMVPLTDGDLVRLVVAGTVVLVPTHFVATWLAPRIVETATHAGAPPIEGGSYTVALAGSPANGVLALPAPVGLIAGLAAVLAMRAALALWPHRMYTLAGASDEKAAEFVDRRH
jgi:PTS system galactitol-specific IIC component